MLWGKGSTGRGLAIFIFVVKKGLTEKLRYVNSFINSESYGCACVEKDHNS